MDLLEQCRLWHEQEEHEKIARALEALPEEQRTAETDMELARAYNNLAQPDEPEGRRLLLRAVELMSAHEEDCPDPYSWNFRMGYACYYLDWEGDALNYLLRALELHPGDAPQHNSQKEIGELIEDCRHRLTLPRFTATFDRRARIAWGLLARREEEICRRLEQGDRAGAEAVCAEVLGPVFTRVALWLERDGAGPCRLILADGGQEARRLELAWFHRLMPPALADRWQLLAEDGPGVRTPAGELRPGYAAYRMEPNEDPDADWRLDTVAGSTCCAPLVRQYLEGESAEVDLLHRDGAAAGFLCYPVDGLPEAGRGEAVFALRERLERGLEENAGQAMTLLGGASGLFCGYIDLIAWDLPAVLDAAAELFAASDLAWGSFHSFRRDVGTVRLWNAGEEQEAPLHPETGSLLAPGDIAAMEGCLGESSGRFYDVLEYLENFIEQGKQQGRFTERQARRDLQIALWYAYACLNIDEYEYYYRATRWMPASEAAARGCGAWYYRYAAALLYCGRLEEARRYAEQATVEAPDYPWGWLLAAKLRSHFGQKESALAAVERGLALEPGDYEFLTLRREIEAGASLEQMENHWIDPDSDRQLQAGGDEGAAAKLQAISCITTDEAGLAAFRQVFDPLPGDYSPDGPYCSFHRTVNGRRVEVVFLMNEAALSKLGRDFLEQLRARLDGGGWLEPDDPDGQPGLLDTVLVGLDRVVRLLCRAGGRAVKRFQVVLGPDGAPQSREWARREQPEPEEEAEEQPAGPRWSYTQRQMELVEEHIRVHIGPFDKVFHERVSPDIHVDICLVPPGDDRNYYMLVTMGMGAWRMNVPEELAEHKLERAELAIALPADWKLDEESLKDERWYWPLRLLKGLARMPVTCGTWLGWGHTVYNQEPYAPDTDLCAALLVGLQGALPGGDVCPMPGGDEINFYQVIPLLFEEMEFKKENGAEALLDHMGGVSFVVQPRRPCAALNEPAPDEFLLDDAAWHLQSLREKQLPVEELVVCNHLAIFLRWCVERELVDEAFLAGHDGLGQPDLRPFVRDVLGGRLLSGILNEKGRAFARYYYSQDELISFPSDVDDWSLHWFGPVRYQSDEFRDEAYLFVPFDETYYQGMAALMDRRLAGWMAQDIPGDGEPDEAARALMERLDCFCSYFPPMKDPQPPLAAFGYGRRQAIRDGYIPLLLVEASVWPGPAGAAWPAQPRVEAEPFTLLMGEGGLTWPAVLARVPVTEPWAVFEKVPVGDGGSRLAALAREWYEKYGAVPAALGADWVEFTLPDTPPDAGDSPRDRLAKCLDGRRPVRLAL